MNLIEAQIIQGSEGLQARLTGGTILTLPHLPNTEGGRITVGLRPEAMSMADTGPIAGKVTVIEHLGGETLTYVDIGANTLVTIKSGEAEPIRVGDTIRLTFDAARLHLFGGDGRALP